MRALKVVGLMLCAISLSSFMIASANAAKSQMTGKHHYHHHHATKGKGGGRH
jgi:hypothetical protein